MNYDEFRVGQEVLFSHCDGQLPATILAFNASRSMVQLKIANWLGTHYMPINTITLTKKEKVA